MDAAKEIVPTLAGIIAGFLILMGYIFLVLRPAWSEKLFHYIMARKPKEHIQLVRSGEVNPTRSSLPAKKKGVLTKGKPKTQNRKKPATTPAVPKDATKAKRRVPSSKNVSSFAADKVKSTSSKQSKLAQSSASAATSKAAAVIPTDEKKRNTSHTMNKRANQRQAELTVKARERNVNSLDTPSQTKHLDSLKKTPIQDTLSPRKPWTLPPREIPEIDFDKSEHGFYNFTVTRRGGRLKLPFLRVFFPPNCARTRMKLCFKSVHAKDPMRDKSITLVTPAIHLSERKKAIEKRSFLALNFLCPIEFRVRPLYHPTQHVEEVKLQTTDDSTNLNWKVVKTFNLSEDEEYIQIKLQHFAGFRIICANSSSLIPSCGLFHTLFVKRPTGISDPIQHNFYVLVHSRDDKSCNEANATLSSTAVEVVVHKHFLPIKPPCTFTANLECGSSGMTIDPECIDYDIDAVDQKFLETFPICIMKAADEPSMDHLKYVPIMYTAWSAQHEQPRKTWFQWSVPMFGPCEQSCHSYSASSASSWVINASGPHSIGQQNTYYVLQSPTLSEGSLGLPHNKSEPLFRDHPSEVVREHSLPATLSTARPSNQSNLWFPDRSPKPNQSLISESSSQVQNVWPSGQNETVLKTTSLPTSDTRSNRSGFTSRSPTVRQKMCNSTNETVPKDFAISDQDIPLYTNPATSSNCFLSAEAENFGYETAPKQVTSSMLHEQNPSLPPTSSISINSTAEKCFDSETVPKDIALDASSPISNFVHSVVTTPSSNPVKPMEAQNMTSETIQKSVTESTDQNFDASKNSCVSLETQHLSSETFPKHVDPGAQSESFSTLMPATSGFYLRSNEAASKKTFQNETSPKEIANISAFEHYLPIQHSTPLRSYNLTELSDQTVDSTSILSTKTQETTPDSWVDLTPEVDKCSNDQT